MRNEIWENAANNYRLSEEIGFALREYFPFLDKTIQKELWEIAENNIFFANYLAYGVGKHFPLLDKSIQNSIIDMIKNRKKIITQFLETKKLSDEFKSIILQGGKARRYFQGSKDEEFFNDLNRFAESFGYGMGRAYHKFHNTNLRNLLWTELHDNEQFVSYFSQGIDKTFAFLDTKVQKELWIHAKTNPNFRKDFFIILGKTFPSLEHSLQEEILQSINEGIYGKYGILKGLSVTMISCNLQMKKRS